MGIDNLTEHLAQLLTKKGTKRQVKKLKTMVNKRFGAQDKKEVLEMVNAIIAAFNVVSPYTCTQTSVYVSIKGSSII